MLQPDPSLAPIQYAPTLLTGAVFAAGILAGIGVTSAARWGARQAGRARAVAAAAGQLVVVRAPDGRCEALATPPRFDALFASAPRAGRELPAWRPEIADALAELATRAGKTLAQAATSECTVDGVRLRLAVGRLGGHEGLLVTITEAGADAARLNQFEAAALLSGGLAHDLLNVLNTLCLHADTAALKPGVPPAVLTHLDRVRAGGQRAADLVSLLRRHLRADGVGDGPPQQLSLGDVVGEAVDLLRPVFPRGLALELSLAPDAFVVAREPVQVHQIALNLVLNAAQALESRPAPRLQVTVATEEGALGREAVLVVADNGPGMPPEVRARCFDPYFTTKGEQRGTGLGLAVVRMLVVDALHGWVGVDETPGGGARFVVRLPGAPSVTPGETSIGTGEPVYART